MGTNCTNKWNGIKVIRLSHSVDIKRFLSPLPSCLRTPHLCSQFSSVGIASQNHCLSHRSPSQDHNKFRQTHIHSMEYKTIKEALMTLPLMFSLLFDKDRLFTAKGIAGLPFFHKQTERKKERKRDFTNFFILLKYILRLKLQKIYQ